LFEDIELFDNLEIEVLAVFDMNYWLENQSRKSKFDQIKVIFEIIEPLIRISNNLKVIHKCAKFF
jgi:hypothetical protein